VGEPLVRLGFGTFLRRLSGPLEGGTSFFLTQVAQGARHS
jgi:hypothetical protein